MNFKHITYMTGIRPSVPLGSSGNTSSGESMHIGNYFGALKNFIEATGNKQFLIADSSTLSGKDSYLETSNIMKSAAAYYALGVLHNGIDSYMYLQSGGKNHITPFYELFVLLSSTTKVSDILIELKRRKTIEGRSYDVEDLDCLDFLYPNHMAADVILANPDVIPVGESNCGNIEYIQKLILYLNTQISEPQNQLKIPDILLSQPNHQNILGTCGTGVKMSKSDNNELSLFVSQAIRKKQISKINSINVSEYLLGVLDPSIPSGLIEKNKRKIFELLEYMFRAKNKLYDEIKDDSGYIVSLLDAGNKKYLKRAEKVINIIRPIYFR